MLIQHGRISPVTGEKLFYYVCSLKRKSHKKLCNNKNAKASEIENLVLLKLKLMYAEKSKYMATLKSKYNNKQINNFDIDIKVLEKKLTDNKSIIDGLVTKLALTKDKEVIDILMDKISSVKKEANEISVKIQNMQNEIQKQKLDVLNLELIEDMLNKCSKIDKLPREEQKQLIDILVDVIYYYGPDDNNPKSKIEIKFVGDIDLSEINNSASDMLQNCSPSMTCIKKNDILSKLF
ncbi:zinc ribbon domain-containing protein [Clostridium butyricum]